jgi:hypothetical protein
MEFCRYWSSPVFKAKSKQKRLNREKDLKHRYNTDGHVHKSQRMVRFRGSSDIYIYVCCHATNTELQAKQDGVVRSQIKVFVEHHRGPNPLNPDQLYSQSATYALVSSHHFSMVCTIVLSLTCISVAFSE